MLSIPIPSVLIVMLSSQLVKEAIHLPLPIVMHTLTTPIMVTILTTVIIALAGGVRRH
jgi:hypothetical protein